MKKTQNQIRARMVSDPLTYFVVAAKHEHLSRAAQELDISQPALSRNIARLEKECGSQLFDRLGRGVRLNAAGRILMQHVQRAIADLEDASAMINEHSNSVARTVSIGFLGTFGAALIPEMIRGFNAHSDEGPGRFRLLQGSHPFLLNKLNAREIDLCVSSPGFHDASIEWRKIYDEELFLVVASDHPLSNRQEVDLQEIADEPVILLQPQYGLRQITDGIFREAGFTPTIAFEAEEVPTMRGLVGAGIGVAIAPSAIFVSTALTVDLRISSPICRRPVGISWRKDRRLSPQTRAFRDYVIDREWQPH
jgi:DNA-binding transcriptional LysR family regulator